MAEKGTERVSLKFSLKCSQWLWRRNFWWKTVPSFCCSNRERSVTDRGEPCQWYSQCWDRRWPQALSTRKYSNRLYSISQVHWRKSVDKLVDQHIQFVCYSLWH